MCVCVCVCVCARARVRVIDAGMCINTNIHKYIRRKYIRKYIHTYIRMYVNVCIYECVCLYIHTRTYTHPPNTHLHLSSLLHLRLNSGGNTLS